MKGQSASPFRFMRIPVVNYPLLVEPNCGAVLLDGDIGTAEAAQILGCSVRHIQVLCHVGVIKEEKEWHKRPGRAFGGKVYRIKRSAVLRLRLGDPEARR